MSLTLRDCALLCVFPLLVGGCATVREVEVPVEVRVPVAVECPDASVRQAGPAPALPIDNIDDKTAIDRDVNLWRSTVLTLQAYLSLVGTERDDLRSALDVCQGKN